MKFQAIEEDRVLLFAMTLEMCRNLGMTEKEVLQMFHPKNIKGGFSILNNRTGEA